MPQACEKTRVGGPSSFFGAIGTTADSLTLTKVDIARKRHQHPPRLGAVCRPQNHLPLQQTKHNYTPFCHNNDTTIKHASITHSSASNPTHQHLVHVQQPRRHLSHQTNHNKLPLLPKSKKLRIPSPSESLCLQFSY